MTRLQRLHRLSSALPVLWLGLSLCGTTQSQPTIPATTLPSAGRLVSGQAQWQQSGNTLTVTQSSARAVIDWSSFNVGSQASVQFAQPSVSAATLNRVLDGNPSVLLGRITAPGQLFISNPAGILFGTSAQVDVGGLVATTLTTPPDQFSANATSWQGTGNASVVNQGLITTREGGYIVLMAPTLRNAGTLQSPQGTVALAAGDKVTLRLLGSSLIGVDIDQGSLNALVENQQLIRADGGQILLTAKAAHALADSVIRNTGTLQAQTLSQQPGRILLRNDPQRGVVLVQGTLDASAPNGGDGGSIETSAAQVKVGEGTVVDTRAPQGRNGTWLVDPQDFTVSSLNGDISGTQLSRNLATTNIELQSVSGERAGSGNLNLNDAVRWSSNTTLTLSATRDVNINAAVQATGTQAGVVLRPNSNLGGQPADGDGRLRISSTASIELPNVPATSSTALIISGVPYTVINQLGSEGSLTGLDLQGINGNLSGHYALGRSLDASLTAYWNNGSGFTPLGLGNGAAGFSGVFTGLGNSISNLSINNASGLGSGLFSHTTAAAVVGQIHLLGGTITGTTHNVGALIGLNAGGLIDSSATSRVVLSNINGADTQPILSLGGLVGSNLNTGRISQSYFMGAGVLYNNMDVSASHLGGLTGMNAGQIDQSFATASLRAYNVRNTPVETLGGLVGRNSPEGSLSDVFANVQITTLSAQGLAGGLVGLNQGLVQRAYAQGNASAPLGAGGLFGSNTHADSRDLVWQSNASLACAAGDCANISTTRVSAADLLTATPFAPWDFATTWLQYPGRSSPLLRAFLTPLTVVANNFEQVYNTQSYLGQAGVNYSLSPGSTLLGTLSYATGLGSKNVGSYLIHPQGLYSTDPLGYDIQYIPGQYTVTPATLQIGGLRVATKYADGSLKATLVGQAQVSVLGLDDVSVSAAQTAQFASPEVGASKPVTADGFTLSGVDAGNYRLAGPVSLRGDIREFPAAQPLAEGARVLSPLVSPVSLGSIAQPLDRAAKVRQLEELLLGTP